jgi:predicted ATP-grasp superfamily ATP-dependent carboligase
MSSSVPAVVFSAETYCALGIVRSLGRMGVRVLCVDHRDNALAAASRYCAGAYKWNFDSKPADESAAFLVELGKMIGGKPVLIPTFDERALLVDRFRERLSQWFRLPQPRAGAVARLYSKQTLFELCRRCGVPAPETAFPGSADEVVRHAAAMRFPVALKAIDPDRLARRTGRRMAVAHTMPELLHEFAVLDEPGFRNLALQEYVSGSATDRWLISAYFDRDSRCRFALTGQKLRQVPATGGITTLGVCAPCEAIVTSISEIARAAGYHGIIDADFCHDSCDGLWKLLDVNPRAGANFRLCVDRNALDVVRALYLDLTDQPIPETSPLWGRRWMVEDKDFFACRELASKGAGRGVRDWWQALWHVSERAHVCSDDLLPGLRFCAAVATSALRSLARRARGRMPRGSTP